MYKIVTSDISQLFGDQSYFFFSSICVHKQTYAVDTKKKKNDHSKDISYIHWGTNILQSCPVQPAFTFGFTSENSFIQKRIINSVVFKIREKKVIKKSKFIVLIFFIIW